MYKECYEYAKAVNFSIDEMTYIAKKYCISNYEALENARKYYIYYLGNDNTSWNELIGFRDEINIDKLSRLLNSSSELRNLYIMLGGGDYQGFILNLSKYCYEYCESVLFDINSVKARALELKMPYYKFRNYAKDYALFVLGYDKFHLVSDKVNLTSEVKLQGLLTAWINYSSKREKCYRLVGGDDYWTFKERLMRMTYEYAKRVSFDKEKMTKYGHNFDLSYQVVRRYVVNYARDYLRMNSYDINNLFNINKNNEDRDVLLWINDSEKRRAIYQQLGNLPYREFKQALYKMCYEYGVRVSFNANEIAKLADELDLAPTTILKYIQKYEIDVLKLTSKELCMIHGRVDYQELLNKWLEKSRNHVLLYELLGKGNYFDFLDKLEEFCYNYVSSNDYSYKKIKEFSIRWDISIKKIKKYLINYGKKNAMLLDEIVMRLRMVDENCENDVVDRDSDEVRNANGVVLEFVDSEFDRIYEFCQDKKISVREFNLMTGLVKEYNNELYQSYQIKVSRYRNKINALILSELVMIIKYIKNGILDNDVVREFNLYDYYMITKIPLESLINFGYTWLSSEDICVFKNFMMKYNDTNKIGEDIILDDNFKIDNKRVLYYVKMAIIRYLKENNMPVNYSLFLIVYNEYVNGRYILLKEREKRLIKVK